MFCDISVLQSSTWSWSDSSLSSLDWLICVVDILGPCSESSIRPVIWYPCSGSFARSATLGPCLRSLVDFFTSVSIREKYHANCNVDFMSTNSLTRPSAKEYIDQSHNGSSAICKLQVIVIWHNTILYLQIYIISQCNLTVQHVLHQCKKPCKKRKL